MSYVIQKGIAISGKRRSKRDTPPFGLMEIGDSFLVPIGTYTGTPRREQSSISALASQYAKSKAGSGKKFTVRTRTMDKDGEKGFRVWRIA